MLCSFCWFSDPTWPQHHNTSQRTGAQSAEPCKRHWPHAGFYVRENLALSAQGQLRIREHEQIGSEFIEAQVRASCGTAINVIKMIMFISMHLLSITQLVTVQQLLMFRFWAAGQIPCSTSDLSLIRYQHWQQPSGDGLEEHWELFSVGLLIAGKHFSCKTCCGTCLFQKWSKQKKQTKKTKTAYQFDMHVKVCFVC